MFERSIENPARPEQEDQTKPNQEKKFQSAPSGAEQRLVEQIEMTGHDDPRTVLEKIAQGKDEPSSSEGSQDKEKSENGAMENRDTPEPIHASKQEKNVEQSPKAEAPINRRTFQTLIESTQRIRRILGDRESNRYNALLDPNALARLSAATQRLDLATNEKRINVEEVHSAIVGIASTLNEIGAVRTTSVRDDPESLGQLIFALREVGESCGNAGRSLAAAQNPEAQSLNQSLRSLYQSAERGFQVVARKRDALRR